MAMLYLMGLLMVEARKVSTEWGEACVVSTDHEGENTEWVGRKGRRESKARRGEDGQALPQGQHGQGEEWGSGSAARQVGRR